MRASRGFTILETVLAASMGALLVVVVVGLLGMIDRTERLTSRRQRDTATLAQLHEFMDRTFSSLVMIDGVTQVKQASAESRPRVVLEAAGSEHGARPPAGTVPMQRLEVVVEKSPVPPGWGGGPLADTSYAAQDQDIRATRGVFEMRPGKGKDGAKDGTKDGTWSLWWRPLPPTAEGGDALAYRADPTDDQRASLVADGLTVCQWMAFKNRERSPAMTATRFDDLPAYMEMQVATASGLTHNWMFEVQWTNGPETGVEADAIAAAQEAMANFNGGPAAAAAAAAAATGAAGGPAIAATGALSGGFAKGGAPVAGQGTAVDMSKPRTKKGGLGAASDNVAGAPR